MQDFNLIIFPRSQTVNFTLNFVITRRESSDSLKILSAAIICKSGQLHISLAFFLSVFHLHYIMYIYRREIVWYCITFILSHFLQLVIGVCYWKTSRVAFRYAKISSRLYPRTYLTRDKHR